MGLVQGLESRDQAQGPASWSSSALPGAGVCSPSAVRFLLLSLLLDFLVQGWEVCAAQPSRSSVLKPGHGHHKGRRRNGVHPCAGWGSALPLSVCDSEVESDIVRPRHLSTSEQKQNTYCVIDDLLQQDHHMETWGITSPGVLVTEKLFSARSCNFIIYLITPPHTHTHSQNARCARKQTWGPPTCESCTLPTELLPGVDIDTSPGLRGGFAP